MKKSIPSNSKIKYFLLSILFSILFIFTALNISPTLTAYAEVYAQLAQVELEKRAKRQAEGIAVAKANGVYKGRKPIQLDNKQFELVYTR